MTKILHKLILILSICFFVGCASSARYTMMIPDGETLKPVPDNFFLKNEIFLTEVTGGEETNSMWTSEVDNEGFRKAIEESLRYQQLLAPGNSNGKYRLRVNLEEVDQPSFGLNFTVTSTANYLLQGNKSKNTIFDKKITSSHTATFGDAAYGPNRLKLANEGSIKENIKNFISMLLQLKGE